jgi:hypothetical protein
MRQREKKTQDGKKGEESDKERAKAMQIQKSFSNV